MELINFLTHYKSKQRCSSNTIFFCLLLYSNIHWAHYSMWVESLIVFKSKQLFRYWSNSNPWSSDYYFGISDFYYTKQQNQLVWWITRFLSLLFPNTSTYSQWQKLKWLMVKYCVRSTHIYNLCLDPNKDLSLIHI